MRTKFGFRREWTAAAADAWTREDVAAVILGALSFALIALGTPYAFLLRPVGFLLLLLGVVSGVLLLWLVGPKIEAVSRDYEKKQKQYLEGLERMVRWEDTDG